MDVECVKGCRRPCASHGALSSPGCCPRARGVRPATSVSCPSRWWAWVGVLQVGFMLIQEAPASCLPSPHEGQGLVSPCPPACGGQDVPRALLTRDLVSRAPGPRRLCCAPGAPGGEQLLGEGPSPRSTRGSSPRGPGSLRVEFVGKGVRASLLFWVLRSRCPQPGGVSSFPPRDPGHWQQP